MTPRAVLTCIPPHLHDHVFTPRHYNMATPERQSKPVAQMEDRPPPSEMITSHTHSQPTWPSEKSTWTPHGPTPQQPSAADSPSEKYTGLLPISKQPPRHPRTPRLISTIAVALLFIFTYLTPFNTIYHRFTPSSQVTPLSESFVNHCESLLKVPDDTHPTRLSNLASLLSNNVWVAEPGPSVEYFLGGFGPNSWSQSERPFLIAVGDDSQVVIVTPAFEQSRAQQHKLPKPVADRITWLPWAESESPYKTLAKHFNNRPVILDGGVRTFINEGIRQNQEVKTNPEIAKLRQHKDEREIGLMRCANQFTLHAIRKTREKMHIGIRESETRKILYGEMAALGLSDNGALILFGEDAALPHGTGSDRRLGIEEFVLIDAGGRWGGYVADITRTFGLSDSKISDAHREVWEIVRAAQRAPAVLVNHSERSDHVQFSWLDDVAREAVKKGMAAYGVKPRPGGGPDYTVFTHRLGHGIGLEGHESPYVVQGPLGEQRVLLGTSVTFEPGVYIPAGSEVGDESVNGLGVRLEDVVVFQEGEGGKIVVDWLTGPVEKWGDI